MISSVAAIKGTIEESGERLGGHWLEDMRVEAGRPGRRNVERLGAAADGYGQDSAEAGIPAEPPDESESVEPWHFEVTQNEIRLSVENESKGLLAVPSPPGLNAEGRNDRHEGRPRVRIVLDDEDLQIPRPGPAQNFHPGERRRATARIAGLLRRAASGC